MLLLLLATSMGYWLWRLPQLLGRDSAYIIIPAHLANDAALQVATNDLISFLRTQGLQAVVVSGEQSSPLPLNAYLIGDSKSPWAADLARDAGFALPSLKPEGYFLWRGNNGAQQPTVVMGADVLGMTYGIFRLIEELKLDPQGTGLAQGLLAQPHMTLRLVSDPLIPAYLAPEDALRWGYNAVMVEPWPALARYDRFDLRLYGAGAFPQGRTWVDDNRQRTTARIQRAKTLHLQVVSPGDLPSLPRQALDLYGPQVSDGANPPRLCFNKEKTQQLVAAALEEVLTDFPQIDAIMVRLGENYPLGPLVGNTLEQGDCGWPAYGGEQGYAQRIRLALDLVHQEVVLKRGKLLIQRAWDLRAPGLHNDPATVWQATQGLPSQNLLLSFKHTKSDFWRFSPINPNLGLGVLPQMVEFQVAREYEGKGAFPNYLGFLYAEGGPELEPRGGFRYAYERGVRAVWVWARGGGWGGPVVPNDLWLEVNRYALGRLAWDTGLDPERLALNWATLRFGQKAAPGTARILLRSDEVVLKALYSTPYAGQKDGKEPNFLWVRDDQIAGGDRIRAMYQASVTPTDFALALAEKEQAMALVNQMAADFLQLRPLISDRRTAREAYHTLLYEKALVETLGHYFLGFFHYYRWLDSGRASAEAKGQAKAHFQQWEWAWQDYNRRIVKLSGVATPFKSAGMVEWVQQAMQDLRRE